MGPEDKPVAVLTAMAQEAVALEAGLEHAVLGQRSGLVLREGRLAGVPTVLVTSGIGKVAAAAATELLALAYAPRLLIVVGLAGGLAPEAKAGSFVVATGALQHDFDLRPIAGQRAFLPHLGTDVIEADAEGRRAAEGACREVAAGLGSGVLAGTVLTGDQLVAGDGAKASLASAFPSGVCIDMETAAVAAVARSNGIAWTAIRMISDSADDEFDPAEVLSYCETHGATAMAHAVRLTLAALRKR